MTSGHSRLLPVGIGAGKDSDAGELEMLAVRLRAELLELDVDSVQQAPPEPAPPGTKGPAGDSVSTLLITFSNSATAVALVGLFRSWIKRNSGRNPERTSPKPIPFVRPITPRRFGATPPVRRSAPASRKRRRTAFTSAAISLVGAGAGIWLSQGHSTPRDHSLALTVNTCARTAAQASVPVELGSITTGPAQNDFVDVAFSPDCQILAAGGNGTVQVWNMVTGHRIATVSASPGSVALIDAFTPNGKTLAVAGRDGYTTLCDAANGRLETRLPSDPSATGTYIVAISPDGAELFTGGSTGVVRVWDVTTHKLIAAITTGAAVGAMALSPNGRLLAVAGYDGIIRMYDASTANTYDQVAALPGNQGHIYSVAFSPDGSTLAAGTQNGVLEWWDVATGKLIADRDSPGATVTDVAFSPDGTILAASGDDIAGLWDARTHQLITTLDIGATPAWPNDMAFSRYGAILAVGWNGTLQLWNVAGISRPGQ